MPLKATFLDRCRAAIVAFRQRTKPDPQAFEKWVADRRRAFDAAVEGIEAQADQELVRSLIDRRVVVVSESDMRRVVDLIHDMPIERSSAIIRQIAAAHREIVLLPSVHRWARENASEMTRTFYNPTR